MGLPAIDHLGVWVSAVEQKKSRGRGSGINNSNIGFDRLRSLVLNLAMSRKLVPDDDDAVSCIVDDAYSLSTGFAFKSSTYVTAGTLIFRVTNFDRSGNVDLADSKYFSENEIDKKMSKYLLRKDDILMVMVGGSIGKTTLVQQDLLPALLNQNMWCIRPKRSSIEPSFAHLHIKWLNSSTEDKTESTHGHFTMSKYKARKIIIPSNTEQKRIVAKVDELMGLIDDLEAQTETARESHAELVDALLRTLVESQDPQTLTQNWNTLAEHFDTLFTTEASVERLKATAIDLAVRGKLTGATHEAQLPKSQDEFDLPFALPSDWEVSTIADLCSKVGAGSTPTGGKKIYVEQGIPFLRSQNVWNDGLFLDDISCIPDDIHKKMSGTHVQPEDILYNITGASIGRCAIAPESPFEANVSQHVSIIRLHDKSLNEFVHKVLISSTLQKLMMDVQVGVSREGLGVGKLKKFPIPIPPAEERESIVSRLNDLLGFCDQLLNNIRTSEALKVELAESVVHYASAN